MKFTYILVGIEGGINLGLICRLADNFNINEIRLVDPKLSDEDYDLAEIFASNAAHRLKKLKIYDSVGDSVSDLDIVFGTSGIISYRYPWSQHITPEDMNRIISKFSIEKIGIMFGRESTGLTKEELSYADFIVRIPTSKKYPSLNLSTAVAIISYHIYNLSRELKSMEVKRLGRVEDLKLIAEYVEKISYKLFKKELFSKSLRDIVKRSIALSNLSGSDIKSLVALYRRIFSVLYGEPS